MKTFYQFLTEDTSKEIDSILKKIANKIVKFTDNLLIKKIIFLVKSYHGMKNNNISDDLVKNIMHILPRIKDNAGVIDFESENIRPNLGTPFNKKYTNKYEGFAVNLKFDIFIPITKNTEQVVNKGPAMLCIDSGRNIRLLVEIPTEVYDKIYKLISGENFRELVEPIPYALVKTKNSHYIEFKLYGYKAIDLENATPIKFLSNLDFYDYYSIAAPLRGESVYNFEIDDAIQESINQLTQDASLTKFLKNLASMPDINEIFTRELCSKLGEYKDIDEIEIRNVIKDLLLNFYRELGAN
jgi:hypothetical protein